MLRFSYLMVVLFNQSIMRKINRIVFHCTATTHKATVAGIKKYWKEVRGWKNPGCHILIQPNGIPVPLAHISQVVNGAQGFNHDSIHIFYIGGVDSDGESVDNRTPEQIQTQIFLGTAFHRMFPKADICGHRDLPKVQKDCPCFDVRTDLVPYIIGGDLIPGEAPLVDHPFFKLLQRLKSWSTEGLTPYEEKLISVFKEVTE